MCDTVKEVNKLPLIITYGWTELSINFYTLVYQARRGKTTSGRAIRTGYSTSFSSPQDYSLNWKQAKTDWNLLSTHLLLFCTAG